MKKLSCLLAIALVAVMLVCGCGEKTANNSSSSETISSSLTSSTGTSSNVSSSTSNSTSSSSSIEPIVVDPINPSAKLNELSNLQVIDTMRAISELDDSYKGTDINVGFSKAVSRSEDNFLSYPIGYGEGTTGGRGATSENTYNCTTGLMFIDALNSITAKQVTDADLKSIIIVNGTITQDNSTSTELTTEGKLPEKVYQIIVNSINNLSIIGGAEGGLFDGVGLNFKSSNNIIVQNLTIHHPSKILKNEKDCLEFNKCNYVWVDHNELYNDSPDNTSEKDFYDGLCDVKNSSENVTISYNYIHDAFKTSLVGSGPDDLWENRRLTYHHNIFKNLNSRVPLIRSGYTHIYNNYYEDVNTGINLRIGAQGYVENNIFVNVKNPICSIEETKGFWNAKGNVYENCSGSGLNNQSSGTSFTPSYQYVLDDTANLKTYLDKTVGVGKIDVNVAIATTASYDVYEIPRENIVSREISELGVIKLDNQSMQKLLYISNEIVTKLSSVDGVVGFDEFAGKCKQFLSLYVEEIENRIKSVQTNSDFVSNAIVFYDTIDDFNAMPQVLKNIFNANSEKTAIEDFYNQNFVTKFNGEVQGLQNAVASDLQKLQNLQKLSTRFDGINATGLAEALTSCNNHIAVNNFTTILESLPSASQLTIASFSKVTSAKNAYEAFTPQQKLLLTTDNENKYQAIIAAYNTIIDNSMDMDLSGVSTGKISGSFVKAGSFEIGVSSEVRSLSTSITFGGDSYNKCVFISGYGNAGSKCLKFTAYDTSDIVLIVANEKGNCRIKLTDPDKNEIDGIIASAEGVQQITFKNVAAGEYRIYTDIPSETTTYNGSSLFVYAGSITPAK